MIKKSGKKTFCMDVFCYKIIDIIFSQFSIKITKNYNSFNQKVEFEWEAYDIEVMQVPIVQSSK